MAQVRKHQQGGTFTVDGKAYNWNDIREQYITWAKGLPDEFRNAAADFQKFLDDGQAMTYNSVARSLSGDMDWNYTSDREKRRTRSGKKYSNIKGFVYELGNFLPSKQEKAPITYDYSSTLKLPTAYVDTPETHKIIKRLESLKDIADYSVDSKFKGYGGASRKDYEEWYNRNQTTLESLTDRIKNNTLTPADLEVLKAFGIIKEDSKNTNNTNTDLIDSHTTKGSDGVLELTADFLQKNPNLPSNAIFNDWFLNQALKSGSGLEWLHGYIKIGNKLYSIKDLQSPTSKVYETLNAPGGFVDLNKQGNHQAANELFQYQWGYPDEWTSYNLEEYWHPVFDKIDNVRFRSRTGQVQAPKDSQVWEIATDEYDQYGLPKTRLYQINQDGTSKVLDNNTKIDYLQKALPPQLYQRITDEGLYKGFIQKDIQDQSGQIGATLFYNPTTKELIYHSDQLHTWPGLKKHDNIRSIKFSDKFGPQVRDLLLKYPQILNRILQSSSDSEAWNRIITSPFITAVGDVFRGSHNPSLSDEVYAQMSDEDIAEVKRLLEEYTGTAEGSWSTDKKLWARDARKWIVPKYVPKQQFGGTAPQIQAIDTTEEVEDIQKATEVGGKGTNWNLTTSDKMQIASIVGDIASMVASIPTGGGNPLAAALGIGATGTQFAADVKRDGLDLGDIGTLLFGLGMDVATVVPGLGAAAKSAKLIKQLGKYGKTLKTGLTVVGATSAISALDNILSGKGDLNDWKVLSTGMLALPGITRSVKAVATTKYKGGTKKMSFDELAVTRKKEVIDKAIADNPDLTVYKGKLVEWFDPATKTVTDYDKAAAGLGRNGLFNKWWDRFKTSEEWLGQLFSNKWNPFSKNFALRMSNRELKPEVLTTLHTKSPFTNRVVGNLAMDNPHIARQINNIPGYQAPTQYLVGRHTGPWWYRTYDFTNRAPLTLPGAPMNHPIPQRSYPRIPSTSDVLSVRSDAYKQMVRDAVLARPEFGYFEGSPTRWYNNGQIINMEEAISGLSTDPMFRNWLRANINRYQKGGTVNTIKGEKKPKTSQINWARSIKDVLDATDLGLRLQSAKASRDRNKEALEKVKQYRTQKPVTRVYDRLPGNQYEQLAQKAAESLRTSLSARPATTDAKIESATQLGALSNIEKNLQEAKAQDLAVRLQAETKNNAQKRIYDEIDDQREQQNNQVAAEIEAAKVKTDDVYGQVVDANIGQYITQKRNELAKGIGKMNETALAIESANVERRLKEYEDNAKVRWQALPSESRGSFEDYLERDPQYGKLKNETQTKLLELQRKHLGTALWWLRLPELEAPALKQTTPTLKEQVIEFKKGGKHRPATEQRYLDASKSAEKAIAKLKDEVFKILLQALK